MKYFSVENKVYTLLEIAQVFFKDVDESVMGANEAAEYDEIFEMISNMEIDQTETFENVRGDLIEIARIKI